MKKVLFATTVACLLGTPVVTMAATSSGQHHTYAHPVPFSNTSKQSNATRPSGNTKVPGPVSLQSVLNTMSSANQQKFLQAMNNLPTGSTKNFTQVEWKDYIGQWFTDTMTMDEAQGYISQSDSDAVTSHFKQELQLWNEGDTLRVKVPFRFGIQTWSLWNVNQRTMDINFNA